MNPVHSPPRSCPRDLVLVHLMKQLQDGALILEADDRVSFLNPKAEELTGWSLSEVVGRPRSAIVKLFEENELDLVRLPSVQCLKSETVRSSVPLVLQRPDGSTTLTHYSLSPILDEHGNCAGGMLMLQPLSEEEQTQRALNRSEARFQAFMDNCPAIASIKDVEGRYLYTNRQWRDQFSQLCDDWEGKTDAELFSPRTAERIRESDLRVLQREESIEIEESIEGPDGLRRQWMSLKFPLRDEQGRLLVSTMALDITEKSHLEHQLRQMQKMDAVGKITGGVAHEFNNMLTAINGNASLLLYSMKEGHPWKDLLEAILQAGERSAELTQQLLAFSRLQVMQPRVVDLNELVAQMEKLLYRVLDEQITLRTNLVDSPGSVIVDPRQIEQVILNLVLNARDALPTGGEIVISTDEVVVDAPLGKQLGLASGGLYRQLTVEDNGVGMSAAMLEQICEPFFTTRQQNERSGMGLATVYGIVKQSEGHIHFESEPDVGTKVSIYLPPAEIESGNSEGSPIPLPRGTETVLLVEDEQPVRQVLSRILSMCGYTVLEASSSIEAVRISEQFSGTIHLLLADMILPRMSGWNLAEKIQEDRPAIRTIYISGYSEAELAERGMPGNQSYFVRKPLIPMKLAHLVRQTLDG